MVDLDYELRKLDTENTTEENKQAIRQFVDDLNLEGISEVRRKNYVQRLRVVSRWIPDSFLDPKKEDIRKVFLNLSGEYVREFRGNRKNGAVIKKKYSEYTKSTYLDMLKKFYTWKLGKPESQNLFDKIKVDKRKLKKKGPSDMITEKELDMLIKNAPHIRDRALISTMYDSGCRIGELLLMSVENLNFDAYGAVLQVPWEGKTGFRNVRIVGNSIAYLRAWLDSHPDGNNPKAFLFCDIQRNVGRRMNHSEVYRLLGRTAERAGMKKRIHPHLFRHTRATILASKPLAGSVFEDQMGWIHGSKQTQTYVHLSGKQQDNAILKAYGIDIKEEQDTESKPKECPRCSELNPSNAAKCRKCWMPLTLEEALEQEDKEKQVAHAIGDLISGDQKVLLQNLPEESKLDVLATLLLDFEKTGKLDLIKNRIQK